MNSGSIASSMTLDVPLLRSDTPSVANVVHFNNYRATAVPMAPVDTFPALSTAQSR